MGNITSIGGGPQEVVRLVRQDGKVLEFYDDMPVEELMVVYPTYVVCQDQVQENGLVRRKMLSPKETLQKGQVYLLLQMPPQQQQQKAQHQPHAQRISHNGQRIHVNGGNGPAQKAPQIHPVNVPTAGRDHSAHPPQQQQQKKIGVAVKPVFPKEQIDKIFEAGSVKIITKKGTTRLSGPQLTRLLNKASSHGISNGKLSASYGKSTPSPMASSLGVGLESIPEEPHHKAVAL